MISVLGLPLDEAVARLEGEGFLVEAIEARSIKGVKEPDSLRVIRQSEPSGGEKPVVTLVYSAFRTCVYPSEGE